MWTWLRHLGGVGLILWDWRMVVTLPEHGRSDDSSAARHGNFVVVRFRYYRRRDRRRIHHLRPGAEGRQLLPTQAVEENGGESVSAIRRWGFLGGCPTILPPPFPIVPFAGSGCIGIRAENCRALALGRAFLHHCGWPGAIWPGTSFDSFPNTTSRRCSRSLGLP